VKILGDKDLPAVVGAVCFTFLGLSAYRPFLLAAAFTAALASVFAWTDYLAARRAVRARDRL
jgi:hypothetical protein